MSLDTAPCPHEWTMTSKEDCACNLCGTAPTLWVQRADGTPDVLYKAQAHQLPYHESSLPNLIMIGPRSSGKTICMRLDAHMRALQIPNFKYLVLRRTMPELRRSHLVYINEEMHRLGGTFHNTESVAKYPNGSLGWYGHLDTVADSMKFLSAEYDLVVIDEIVTFDGDQILKISSCARAPNGTNRIAMVRGGMNKLGIGAEFVKKYFVDKNVPAEENADYIPEEWGYISHRYTDNVYTDPNYKKRLQSLPEHVRKAWLDDEWVIEGAYFKDFRQQKDGEPWHVIHELPTFQGRAIVEQPFVNIYRAIDWGYSPDPAVCLWIAVLPNKRAIVFKERTWKETLAEDVAKQIKRESVGMRVVESFCDPSMLINDGKGQYCLGDIFEQNGVPLTPSTNKRDYYGYSIHEYLNTLIDGKPKMQILAGDGKYQGCPQLIKTIPLQRTDAKDPNKLADGDDHWVVSLAYFCQGSALPSQRLATTAKPRWMMPRSMHRGIYG